MKKCVSGVGLVVACASTVVAYAQQNNDLNVQARDFGGARFVSGIAPDSSLSIPQQELDAVVKNYIGQVYSIELVNNLNSAITKLYHSKGFVFSYSFIPAQTVGPDGVITISVVEGKVRGITNSIPSDARNLIALPEGQVIKPDQYPDLKGTGSIRADFLSSANEVVAGNVFTTAAYNRAAMQFGGLPGLSLKAFYAPLSTTPGLGDIVLLPEQKSYAVSYSLDNSGTKNIGPYKASVGLAGYSLLSLHEIIQASYRRGFPKFSESEEYSGYFKIPVTPDGYSAYAMYSNTNADPSGFLSQLDTISKGETFSFGIEKQFNNEGGSNQTVSFSLTTLDNDVLFFDQSVSRDRLSYVRLSASSTNKVTNELIGRFSISADKGVNVFNPNKNPLNQSRTGADIYPWVFNASAETFYNFNDTIQAIVSVNGIYSPDTLPSSLEMSVGGLDTMPGYKPGYMSGKNGIVATAELPIKPCTIAALSPVCWGQTKDGTEVEIAPFVVTAYLDKEAARIGSISASSAGLKLRVRPTTFLSGELVLAGPLKTHSDRQTDRGIDVLFRIQGGF